MFRPNPADVYQEYQPDIKAFCKPNTMNNHPLIIPFPKKRKKNHLSKINVLKILSKNTPSKKNKNLP